MEAHRKALLPVIVEDHGASMRQLRCRRKKQQQEPPPSQLDMEEVEKGNVIQTQVREQESAAVNKDSSKLPTQNTAQRKTSSSIRSKREREPKKKRQAMKKKKQPALHATKKSVAWAHPLNVVMDVQSKASTINTNERPPPHPQDQMVVASVRCVSIVVVTRTSRL